MTTQAELQALVVEVAGAYELPPALVCAIVEQESAWNPYAMRYEPGYRWLWPSPEALDAPRGVSKETEIAQQRISWGLMQVMGAVAREHGCRSPYLSILCAEPRLGLEYGCRLLARLIGRYGRLDLGPAVSAYNAGRPTGGNLESYVRPVLERMALLTCAREE